METPALTGADGAVLWPADFTITEPGVYDAMPEHVYHADPVPDWSLSKSGAQLLVPPNTPAHYLWTRSHPRPATKALDIGTAVHELVLGVGAGVAVIPEDILARNGAASTSEARAFKAEAEAAGQTVLKPTEWAEVKAMHDTLREHPIAGRLFDPDRGRPEQSMFWRDQQHGIWRRARVDWLPNPGSTKRPVIVDYKTARSADPRTWAKAATDLGYHMQDACYRAGLAATTGITERDVVFVFVAQEKTPPYLVSVLELDRESREAGQMLMDRAAAVFADCRANNHWPGYPPDVVQVQLPGWYLNQLDQEMS